MSLDFLYPPNCLQIAKTVTFVMFKLFRLFLHVQRGKTFLYIGNGTIITCIYGYYVYYHKYLATSAIFGANVNSEDADGTSRE